MIKRYHLGLSIRFAFVACCALGAIFTLSRCSSKIDVQWSKVSPPEAPSCTSVRVYLENSGSMDGYMTGGSQLKDAVYDYVSKLIPHTEELDLNYINSRVIPYKSDNLKHFIRDLTPASFRQAGGNRTTSDIADMFARILATTNDGVISIFISDCILDIPEDPTSFLVNRQIGIRNTIAQHLKKDPNLGIEVLVMRSHFNGFYFYAHTKERLSATRPYYIWIFGNKNLLGDLNKKVPLSEIQHGVEQVFAFTTETNVPFSITNSSDVVGEDRHSGRQKEGAVKMLCTGRPSRKGAALFKVRADFTSTLQPEGVLNNRDNYALSSTKGVSIEDVSTLTAQGSEFTHLIRVGIEKSATPHHESLLLLQPDISESLDALNDETGRNVRQNLDRTTGIKYIITGVSEAYSAQRELAKIKFNIKK